MKTESPPEPSQPQEHQPQPVQEADATSPPHPMAVPKSSYKHLSLIILIVQNTALVLVMRYSRTVTVDGVKYLPTTAVVLTELLKLTLCVIMVFFEAGWNLSHGLSLLYVEIIAKKTETIKVSIPSVLYTIQNNLLYLALTYLDAATFQVTYQLKILTTAIFSVVILHRSLSVSKWISLVLLTVAVALVQLSNIGEPSTTQDSSTSSSLLGLMAVLCASVTSGFAGVYTEKILKGSNTSMWIRNIQLALLSFVIGLVGVVVSDRNAVMERGFFQGYSATVVIVISLQALGGLVVAAVMKYADNILKGFAAALSIVLSSLASYFFLGDFHPTMYFVYGMILLLVSTALYNWQQSQSPILPVTTVRPPKSL